MITDLVQREKLKKLASLANFLDDLPHSKFHMPKWVANDATEKSCGTAGCACGWAATIFRKEGWIIRPRYYFNHGEWWGSVEYNGLINHYGFAEFFGLSDQDAEYITVHLRKITEEDGTGPEHIEYEKRPTYTEKYNLAKISDITPQHAADRIREVIRGIDPSILLEPAVVKLEPVGA